MKVLFLLIFLTSCASHQGRTPNYGAFINGLNNMHQKNIQNHQNLVRFHERNNAQKIQIQNTGRLPSNNGQQQCDLRCQHARQLLFQKMYFGQ